MATNFFLDKDPGAPAALFGGAGLAVAALLLCSVAHYEDAHARAPTASPAVPPPLTDLELSASAASHSGTMSDGQSRNLQCVI